MKIIVSKDIVKLNENHSENHYGEYNVNECVFEFDEYFDSVPIKKAIFTSQSNNESFEIDIINNKCTVPHEVLTKVYDTVILGVYGYDVDEETLLVRYSPEPTTFVVHEGSYREGAEQPEIITPTQYDMYSKALQEGLAEVDGRLDDVEKQGDYASEQGDYAKEQGDYAKSEGDNAKSVAEETEKKAEDGLFNGKSLEFVWQGTKLGVRLEGQEEYQFVDLQGVQGEIGATGEPFKIKKTYGSVSEMNADFGNMAFGDYVMIASSVNEEDNAKLYTRGESAWIFISDFSGAMGIRGETGLTPNIQIGEVKTLEPGSQAKVTRSGSNEEPVFNFELPKGDKGDDYVLTEEDKVEIGEKVNTEYEKRIEENEKDIAELEATIDILTNTDTKKGELVHITDALPLPTFENKIYGNVKQEGEPSPTSPQEIEVIEGDLSYKVNGKNLFNKDDVVVGYIDNNGVLHNEQRNRTSNYIKVQPNSNYVRTSTNGNIFYDKDKNFISYTWGNNFITPSNCKYVRIVLIIDDIDNEQFEKGSVPTEYEPYKEQITYLDLKGNWVGKIKDSEIEDELYTDKKNIWLDKNVNKRIFTGEEDWVENTSIGTIELLINDKYARYGFDGLMCSHFHIRTGTDVSNYVGIDNNHTNIRIWGTNMTLDEFKAFAKEEYNKGTPITLVYQTKETETKHLGELPEPIKTFEGTNNIQLLANLDTSIEVKYALDVKKYFENKLASIQEQIL